MCKNEIKATVCGDMLISRGGGFPEHRFKIVERVPRAYIVWNIGDNLGSDDFIPFCQTLPNSYAINPDTLLAVKLPADDVQVLRKVAGRGNTNIKNIIKRINRHRKGDCPRELLERAAAILETITEQTPRKTEARR